VIDKVCFSDSNDDDINAIDFALW